MKITIMKYMFFLNQVDADPHVEYLSRPQTNRLQEVAKIIEGYDFEKAIIVAYPVRKNKKTIEVINEGLDCSIFYTLTLNFDYAMSKERDANAVFEVLLKKQQEQSADAIIFVSKGTELYYTARRAMKELLPALSVFEHVRYFDPTDLMVIDLESRKINFFKYQP